MLKLFKNFVTLSVLEVGLKSWYILWKLIVKAIFGLPEILFYLKYTEKLLSGHWHTTSIKKFILYSILWRLWF